MIDKTHKTTCLVKQIYFQYLEAKYLSTYTEIMVMRAFTNVSRNSLLIYSMNFI